MRPIGFRPDLRSAVVLCAVVAALNLGFVVIPAPQALQAAELATQTNSQGAVTIKVTPQAFSASASDLRFKVVMDTHSVALDQDMRAIAVLSGAGEEYKPTAWEGAPPGGHHREGVLVFAPISPMPGTLTLKLRGIGGVAERAFSWTLPR